jgi:hypothetical protein
MSKKLHSADTISRAAMHNNAQLHGILNDMARNTAKGESVYSFFGVLTSSTQNQLKDLGYEVIWDRNCHKITARLSH